MLVGIFCEKVSIFERLHILHHNTLSAFEGKTGDWKNHFSPELNARIDKWIKCNLAGTDLSFITELEQQD